MIAIVMAPYLLGPIRVTDVSQLRVGGQELQFPESSFDGQIDGRWGPEMRVLALSSDGVRMAVEVQDTGTAKCGTYEQDPFLPCCRWRYGMVQSEVPFCFLGGR